MAKIRKDSQVGASQLPAGELVDKTKYFKGNEAFNPKKYIGKAGDIAGSEIYSRNLRFKNAEKHFPHQPLMRTCDMFFQFAKGGPLFVDEPTTPVEINECEKKLTAMRAEGLRYVYVTQDMSVARALEQLKENTRGMG